MVEDLPFRFRTSRGKFSQIFIMWFKLMLKKLKVLVILLSFQQVKSTLLALKNMFQIHESFLTAHKWLWRHQVALRFRHICIMTIYINIQWIINPIEGFHRYPLFIENVHLILVFLFSEIQIFWIYLNLRSKKHTISRHLQWWHPPTFVTLLSFASVFNS